MQDISVSKNGVQQMIELSSQLNSKSILFDLQHGFLKRRPFETKLIQPSDKIFL